LLRKLTLLLVLVLLLLEATEVAVYLLDEKLVDAAEEVLKVEFCVEVSGVEELTSLWLADLTRLLLLPLFDRNLEWEDGEFVGLAPAEELEDEELDALKLLVLKREV